MGGGTFVIDSNAKDTFGISTLEGDSIQAVTTNPNTRYVRGDPKTVIEADRETERTIFTEARVDFTKDLYSVGSGDRVDWIGRPRPNVDWVSYQSEVEGQAITTAATRTPIPGRDGAYAYSIDKKEYADITGYELYEQKFADGKSRQLTGFSATGNFISFANGISDIDGVGHSPNPGRSSEGGMLDVGMNGAWLLSKPLDSYTTGQEIAGSKATLSQGRGTLGFEREGDEFTSLNTAPMWARGALHFVEGEAEQYIKGKQDYIGRDNEGRAIGAEVDDYGTDTSGLIAISDQGENGQMVTRVGNAQIVVDPLAIDTFGVRTQHEDEVMQAVVTDHEVGRRVGSKEFGAVPSNEAGNNMSPSIELEGPFIDRAAEIDGSDGSINRWAEINFTNDVYEISNNPYSIISDSGYKPEITWNYMKSDVEGTAYFESNGREAQATIFDYTTYHQNVTDTQSHEVTITDLPGFKAVGRFISYAPSLSSGKALEGESRGQETHLSVEGGDVILGSGALTTGDRTGGSHATESMGLGVLSFDRENHSFKDFGTSPLWADGAQHTFTRNIARAVSLDENTKVYAGTAVINHNSVDESGRPGLELINGGSVRFYNPTQTVDFDTKGVWARVIELTGDSQKGFWHGIDEGHRRGLGHNEAIRGSERIGSELERTRTIRNDRKTPHEVWRVRGPFFDGDEAWNHADLISRVDVASKGVWLAFKPWSTALQTVTYYREDGSEKLSDDVKLVGYRLLVENPNLAGERFFENVIIENGADPRMRLFYKQTGSGEGTDADIIELGNTNSGKSDHLVSHWTVGSDGKIYGLFDHYDGGKQVVAYKHFAFGEGTERNSNHDHYNLRMSEPWVPEDARERLQMPMQIMQGEVDHVNLAAVRDNASFMSMGDWSGYEPGWFIWADHSENELAAKDRRYDYVVEARDSLMYGDMPGVIENLSKVAYIDFGFDTISNMAEARHSEDSTLQRGFAWRETDLSDPLAVAAVLEESSNMRSFALALPGWIGETRADLAKSISAYLRGDDLTDDYEMSVSDYIEVGLRSAANTSGGLDYGLMNPGAGNWELIGVLSGQLILTGAKSVRDTANATGKVAVATIVGGVGLIEQAIGKSPEVFGYDRWQSLSDTGDDTAGIGWAWMRSGAVEMIPGVKQTMDRHGEDTYIFGNGWRDSQTYDGDYYGHPMDVAKKGMEYGMDGDIEINPALRTFLVAGGATSRALYAYAFGRIGGAGAGLSATAGVLTEGYDTFRVYNGEEALSSEALTTIGLGTGLAATAWGTGIPQTATSWTFQSGKFLATQVVPRVMVYGTVVGTALYESGLVDKSYYEQVSETNGQSAQGQYSPVIFINNKLVEMGLQFNLAL